MPQHLLTKTLLLALLTFTLSACLDEEGNLFGMDLSGEMSPNEAARTGTEVPEVAYLKSVTYLGKQDVTDDLGHIEINFTTCNELWCRASLDDCGSASGFTFNYQRTDADRSIQFKDFTNSPALTDWAEEDIVFEFTRNGIDIELTCNDCPGVSPNGEQYDGRRVTMQAVR